MRWTILPMLSALLLAAPTDAATLKIATLAPDGTSWMKMMRKGAKEVAKRTKGRVKLRFYPGGVMGNDKSVLRKIRVGQLHGGAVTAGGLAGVYKDIQVYSLPLMFRSFAEVNHVRKHMDAVIIEGLKRKGFISFGLADGGFAYLMSRKPLRSIQDVKGQKVWAPEGDKISRITLQDFGVSPIQLPMTDVLTGLQTGLIDTVASSPIGSIALHWHTRVKYLTDLPLMYLHGTLVIRQKALAKLSAADRQVLAEVMVKTFHEIDRKNRKDNQGAMKALKQQGIQFVRPSTKGQTEWRKRVDATIDKLTRMGVCSPEMVQRMRAHLREYRKNNS